MEIQSVSVVLVAQGVVHVVEQQIQILSAFIGNHNFHSSLKRHWDIAVKTLAFRTGEERGLKCVHMTKPVAEKITKGHGDSGSRSTIPKHFYLQASEHGRTTIINRDPYSVHGPARAMNLGQRKLLACLDGNSRTAFTPCIHCCSFALLPARILRAGPAGFGSFGELVERLCASFPGLADHDYDKPECKRCGTTHENFSLFSIGILQCHKGVPHA